jgi:hypothetical protein
MDAVSILLDHELLNVKKRPGLYRTAPGGCWDTAIAVSEKGSSAVDNDVTPLDYAVYRDQKQIAHKMLATER